MFWSNKDQFRDTRNYFPLLYAFLLFAHFSADLLSTLLGLQGLPQSKGKGPQLTMELNVSSPAYHIQKHCILRLNTPWNEKLSLLWKEFWKQFRDCRIGDLLLQLWNLSIDVAAREETRGRRKLDRRLDAGRESRDDTANRESLENKTENSD